MAIELLVSGLLEGTRIGLAGLGFAIIFYTTEELHFAYGAMVTASAYLAYVLLTGVGLPGVLTVLIVLLAGALAGALIQRYLYRHLQTIPHAVLLFSFGLAIVLENLLHLIFGPEDLVLPSSSLTQVVEFTWPVTIFVRVIDFVAVGTFVITWLLIYYLLNRHRVGMALRAVMHDPEMSELVGIRTGRVKVVAYALGSAIGATSGLIAMVRTGVRPTSGFSIMLFAFIVTLLGVGRIHRVAGWGLGLGVFMGFTAWKLPTELRTLIAFVLMLLYLVVRTYRVPSRAGETTKAAVAETGS